MAVLLDTGLPFLALILCGWLALRAGVLDAASARGLNSFVFWLALPALLLKGVAEAPLRALLDLRFLAVFYGVNGALYVAVLLWALWRGASAGGAGLRALASVWGNYGYLGLPLLTAALGPAGALPAILVIVGDILLPAAVTIALLERQGGQGGQGGWRRAVSGPARNPLIVAVVLGALLAAAEIRLATPIVVFLDLVGSAAGPCALVALGASLASARAGRIDAELALIGGVKLVLSPALMFLVGVFVLPLPAERVIAAALLTALPTAASVYVIAQRHDVWVARASTTVLLTHLAGAISVGTLLAFWL